MTRPEQPTCASQPEEEIDTLYERWLAPFPQSHRRLQVAPVRPASTPPEPIGDRLADAWFR